MKRTEFWWPFRVSFPEEFAENSSVSHTNIFYSISFTSFINEVTVHTTFTWLITQDKGLPNKKFDWWWGDSNPGPAHWKLVLMTVWIVSTVWWGQSERLVTRACVPIFCDANDESQWPVRMQVFVDRKIRNMKCIAKILRSPSNEWIWSSS